MTVGFSALPIGSLPLPDPPKLMRETHVRFPRRHVAPPERVRYSPSVPDRLLLIDGSSQFHRAFYGIPRLSNSRGLPTNAVKGFFRMLRRSVARFHPAYVAVVFDAARKSFRNDLYPEYKAHRPPTPDDLAVQIPFIKEIPRLLGFRTIERDDAEADDILATLARQASEKGLQVVIVTADKDLMQTVTLRVEDESAGVILYDESKDRPIGVGEVIERFGVPPNRVPDVLGLAGDATDNIPGVTGVGEKTAAELVARLGSVEEILQDPSRVERPKIRETLSKEAERARLSLRLATLVTDLPIPLDLDSLRPGPGDPARLRTVLEDLEFRQELRELGVEVQAGAVTRSLFRRAEEVEEYLKGAAEIAVRTFIHAEPGRPPRVVGLAVCPRPGMAAYVPVGHTGLGAGEQIPLERIRPILAARAITALDVKREHRLLGPFDPARSWDVMLAAYLLDPERGPMAVDRLAKEFLGSEVRTVEGLLGGGKKRIPVDQLAPEEVQGPACDEVEALLRLREPLQQRLRGTPLEGLLREIEMPLAFVLADIEAAGVRIDMDALRAMASEFARTMQSIEAEAHRIAGVEFDLNSPKQTAEVLFDRLGLPSGKKTKTGRSTDAEVLEALAEKHPLPKLLLRFRFLSKLRGTYLEALPALVDPRDGRVHTTFRQAETATGRVSSRDPNLQNIPVRTEEGQAIRSAFVAAPGHVLVVADYSQIELRILAHMSEDPVLCRAFSEGKDIHAATAAEIHGVPVERVTPELRRVAKTVNFGIAYGMSPHGLSQRLGISLPEARRMIEGYFEKFPKVRGFLDSVVAGARSRGYVETLFGRRRYARGIDSKNGAVRQAAERAAINAPIQGTAADLIKIAMVRLSAPLRELGARMILQVHDELVVEVPIGREGEVAARLKAGMEGVASLRVPLVVELGIGPSWAKASP